MPIYISQVFLMPKHEPGTAAHISNQMRKNTKTKIRWYCGLCHVACKDENGYKCHLEHETHIHREQAVQESLRSFKVSKEDEKFKRKFIRYLVTKHFGQTVLAHEIYRELYPIDRAQNIMKTTCWETLGVFIAQLRKEGAIEAAKGIKGWQIRITSQDFSDDDGEKETTTRDVQEVSKSTSVHEDIQKVSLKRMRNEFMETHSQSTGRNSLERVAFSIATASSSGPISKPKPAPNPFGEDGDTD